MLDRSPGRDALSARLETAVTQAPRLAAHPERTGPGPARTVWVDDDDSSVDDHLRAMALAEPGSTRQLLDLIALLESVPFDPERSPWDVTLIEGLERGGLRCTCAPITC